MRARAAALAVLLIGAAACKDDKAEIERARAAEAASKKEAIAKHSPDARVKIDRARKTRALVSTAHRADEGAMPPVTDPKLRLLELHDDERANADLMLRSELSRFERGILGSCRYNDAQAWSDSVSTAVEQNLRRCAKVRWFLVARTDVKVEPKLSGSTTYTGGIYTGDVVVFDLANDPPKVAGAFPIEVVLDKPVKVPANATKEMQEYELSEALRKELLKQIEKATAD